MKQLNEHIDELISHYLNGDISEKDANILKGWVQFSDENKAYFILQKEIWLQYHERDIQKHFDKNRGYTKFRASIKGTNKVTRKLIVSLLSAAVLIISFLLLRPSSITVQNTSTELLSYILPDSSEAILRAHASITVHPSWMKKGYSITQNSGEVYYDAVPQKEQQFKISAHEYQVVVVGTKFTVSIADSLFEVSVIEGNVRVENTKRGGEKYSLNPNEMVSFNLTTNQVTEQTITDGNYFYWIADYFIFENDSLGYVFSLAEKKFNVSFVVANKAVLKCRFSGKIPTKDLTSLLVILEYAFDIKFVTEGDVVKAVGDSCN